MAFQKTSYFLFVILGAKNNKIRPAMVWKEINIEFSMELLKKSGTSSMRERWSKTRIILITKLSLFYPLCKNSVLVCGAINHLNLRFTFIAQNILSFTSDNVKFKTYYITLLLYDDIILLQKTTTT